MVSKRGILSKAVKLGAGAELLELYRSFNGFEYDFGDVDESIAKYSLDPGDKKGEVLLPVTQGRNRVAYCILAHAFRTRGYEPVIPICDNDLSICHYKGAMYNEDDLASCAQCHHYGRNLLDEFGLKYVEISSVSEADVKAPPEAGSGSEFEVEYRGVDIGRYALASTRQFLMKRTVDTTVKRESEIYQRFVSSAKSIVDTAADILANRPIDAVLGFHSPYIYAGLYLRVAEKYDIPAYSVMRGYEDKTLIFGNQTNRSVLPPYTDKDYVLQFLDKELKPSEKDAVEEVIRGRESGDRARIDCVGDSSSSVDVESGGKTIGLFTNLIWDASLEADERLFSDPYQWLQSTIETVDSDDEITLVIKLHPAESLRGTNERVGDWIREEYSCLPENVILLDPDTDVNTYQLIDEIDACIVYNSTVGLESAYKNTPVIVSGETHYRDLGFTFDPGTKTEYTDLVRNCGDISMTTEMTRRAERYSYLLFVAKHIDFPFYESNENGAAQPLQMTHDDIKPGNRNLDFIVERILTDLPIVEETEELH